MAKYLIISDVHHRTAKVNAILAHEKWDKVIFLGDWFDQFNDTYEDARKTAEWLKENLHNPNFIFLEGNHDISYRYSGNSHNYCSGFAWDKNLEIHKVLNKDDWNKFKLFHYEPSILFSHAGLSPAFLKEYASSEVDSIDKLLEWLNINEKQARVELENNKGHFLYNAGYDRGGNAKIGGMVWRDLSNTVPIFCNQAIGHTPVKSPGFITKNIKGGISAFVAEAAQEQDLKNKSWILALDTHTHHYAVLDNNELTINKVLWKSEYPNEGTDKDEIKTVIRQFKGNIPI